MSTDSSRPTAISMASDTLFQAMQLIAPAGKRKSAAASSRAAALNLASDALMLASTLIARLRLADLASSRGREIAAVRAMAGQMQYTDHRMASDMLAAADRHERENDSESKTLR